MFRKINGGEMQMNHLGEAYYNLAVELFESGYYEAAVKYWIQAYELEYEKEQILENLYSCFIMPNEQEFKNNYVQNQQDITQLPYEACELDFIPVTEKRFYIFDKKEQKFLGDFELEEDLTGGQEDFHSILYADTWDIREMLPQIKEKKYNPVYMVLNQAEAKFISFLKLPQFKKIYLENVVVFQNTEVMYAVFSQYTDFYLPKRMIAAQPEKYLSILKELHNARVQNVEQERNHVFLSICIPSYNRGTILLENVRHLLQSVYDSEIEIVISNNGSTEDTEGYKELEKMKDSRIHYYKFDENQGFATNVLKTLELARGQYAMLASDEDMMLIEHLGECLSCLYTNPECGVFWTQGKGGEYAGLEKAPIYSTGLLALEEMSNLNYMTGVTYNMQCFREQQVLEKIDRMRGNVFLEYYVHIPVALLTGKMSCFKIMQVVLWDATKTAAGQTGIKGYSLPQNRVAQQKGILEILDKGVGLNKSAFCNLFAGRIQKTYNLLELVYVIYYQQMSAASTWEETCFYVHKENKKYLNEFPYDLTEQEKSNLQKNLEKIFFDALHSQRILQRCSLEEQREKINLHYTIQIEMQKNGKSVEEVETMYSEHLAETDREKVMPQCVETFLKNAEG